MAIKKIKRTIYFYELDLSYVNKPINEKEEFIGFFRLLNELSHNKKSVRYQYFGEKFIYVQDLIFEASNQMIRGKVRCIRTDVFPEIMNTVTDDIRGIETTIDEGIVETTHFIIDYSKPTKTLAIEYNQFGSKTQDLLNYLTQIGHDTNTVREIKWRPVVNDDLKEFKKRMGRFSQLVVKVHKNHLSDLKALNNELWSAMETSIKYFQSEVATLTLKFDYLQRTDTNEAESIINSIINNLIKNKKNTEVFNILTVKAEDVDKNNLLSTFDLLIDRVKCELNVEKKEKYKTVVSADIFTQMTRELFKIIYS